MPLPKGISKRKARKLRRCERRLMDVRGINPYAVCRASVLGKKVKCNAKAKTYD